MTTHIGTTPDGTRVLVTSDDAGPYEIKFDEDGRWGVPTTLSEAGA